MVVFGADHVYRMDPRQMVEQHIETGAGGDRRRHPGARVARPSSSASSTARRARQDRGLPREAGRPARPARRPRRVVRLDGQLRLHHRGAGRGAARRRRRRGLRARHGRQHHPDADEGRATPRSTTSPTTTCPGRPTATAATGATSGPSTPTTTRTWTSSSVHPIFNLYNRQWPILTDPPPLPPAKFVEGGNAHESIVGAGSIIWPAPRSGTRSSSHDVTVAAGRLRRGRGAHARRADRARRGRAPRDPGQERAWSPTVPRSAWTSSATASATP